MNPNIQKIINKFAKLEHKSAYEAVILFGSYAIGDYSDDSDIDILIVNDNGESELINPYIDGIKIDLSFNSYDRLVTLTENQIKKKLRRPMIAGAKVLFDKNGRTTKYVNEVSLNSPSAITDKEEAEIRFGIYHSTNKIERNIKDNPVATMLTMHTSLDEVLKYHYRINQRWFLSSKKLIKDLEKWDKEFLTLLTKFLEESEVNNKYNLWLEIIHYILKPIGGLKPLNESIPSKFDEDLKIILN